LLNRQVGWLGTFQDFIAFQVNETTLVRFANASLCNSMQVARRGDPASREIMPLAATVSRRSTAKLPTNITAGAGQKAHSAMCMREMDGSVQSCLQSRPPC
jgi:hypothetical protein